jgi:hypothetical protein
MTRMTPLVPLACLALALPMAASVDRTGLPTAPPGPAAENGWTPLFDGASLQGWRGYRKPDAGGTRWRVQNGLLTLPPKGGQDGGATIDLITAGTYDHFELEFDWRVSPGGNSGVKYFVLEDHNSAIGHEYQILDDEQHADAKVGRHRQTASFYDVLPPAVPGNGAPFKPAGEWNTGMIRVAPSETVAGGTRVVHYLNGTSVLEYELDSPELRAAIAKSKFKDVERFGTLQKGHILLQDHSDQVWYRNVRIRSAEQMRQGASGAATSPVWRAGVPAAEE